jgi:squalene-hopene/tetraprenyl-beta-curcumene cyclase
MLTENSSLSGSDLNSSSTNYSSFGLDKAISLAKSHLLNLQDSTGFWVFELEADCTIPAEYILMMHFMAEIDAKLQSKIANFLRSQQSNDGSYPLYKGGEGDIIDPAP